MPSWQLPRLNRHGEYSVDLFLHIQLHVLYFIRSFQVKRGRSVAKQDEADIGIGKAQVRCQT
jgi:hypothetical protein